MHPVIREIAGQTSHSTNERLLGGSVTYLLQTLPTIIARSTLTTQLGEETMNMMPAVNCEHDATLEIVAKAQ